MLPDTITIWVIIGAAFVDSVNPCVLGVLIFLIAFMTQVFKSRTKMLIGGLLYTGVVYATYLALGFGILHIAINTGFASTFYFLAALVAILFGLLEMKDFFWYGRWFSLEMLPGGARRASLHRRAVFCNPRAPCGRGVCAGRATSPPVQPCVCATASFRHSHCLSWRCLGNA